MTLQEEKIIATVEALADDIFDFTARLVAEESTLRNEKGALRLMADELRRLGLPVRLVPIDYDVLRAHPGFAPVPWGAEERWNVVSRVQPEPTAPEGMGGKSALFNGHLDVVSAEPLELWTRDPFAPEVHDGWMYGRGAGDMKAGVAAMTYAVHALRQAGFGLASPLTLETVIEGKSSGNGALTCRAADVDAAAVLIPKPVGPRLVTAQVGVLWFRLDLGAARTGTRQNAGGDTPLEKCFPLIQALRALEAELNEGPLPAPFDALEHPLNLTVGSLASGAWPSSVPALATLHGRLAYLPGQHFPEIRQRVETAVASAVRADPWLRENPPRLEFYGFRSDGHVESREIAPLRTLDACHQELSGAPAEEAVATRTTDLRAFYGFGTARGCCYGPVAENLHAADERVRLDSVIHTAKAYALFAARWCGLVE